jgi:hypothetical protein
MSEESVEFKIPDNLKYNPSGLSGIYKDKVGLSRSSKALNDLVIIELIEQDETKGQSGGIWLPEEAIHNRELLKGRIVHAGPEAVMDGMEPGLIVLYDRFSAFYKPPTAPGTFIITRAFNVIAKCNDEE